VTKVGMFDISAGQLHVMCGTTHDRDVLIAGVISWLSVGMLVALRYSPAFQPAFPFPCINMSFHPHVSSPYPIFQLCEMPVGIIIPTPLHLPCSHISSTDRYTEGHLEGMAKRGQLGIREDKISGVLACRYGLLQSGTDSAGNLCPGAVQLEIPLSEVSIACCRVGLALVGVAGCCFGFVYVGLTCSLQTTEIVQQGDPG
jgi:hypothetical protein